MNLHEKQLLFGKLFPEFLVELQGSEYGYQVKFGECKRTPEQAEWNFRHGLGIANSLHIYLLAGDIELYKDGHWLHTEKDLESFRPAAELWISKHELCRAGFFFKKPDGSIGKDPFHYSITHNGIE